MLQIPLFKIVYNLQQRKKGINKAFEFNFYHKLNIVLHSLMLQLLNIKERQEFPTEFSIRFVQVKIEL